MSLSEDVKIYDHMYGLTKMLIKAREYMDKPYKYLVGERLIDNALECLTLIHFANSDRRDGARYEHLTNFLIRFDVLKTLTMVCQDGRQFKRKIKAQDPKTGETRVTKVYDSVLVGKIFTEMAEIEKQALKWRSSSRKPESHGDK